MENGWMRLINQCYNFNIWLVRTDNLADDLEDIDFEEAANADDEGWETEDEMELERDDSELTFSKHTGICGRHCGHSLR